MKRTLTKREKEVLFLLVEDAQESFTEKIKIDYSKLEESDKETIRKLYDKLK